MAYRMRTGEVYLPNKSDMKIGKKPLRSGITVIQLYNEIERILKSLGKPRLGYEKTAVKPSKFYLTNVLYYITKG